MTRPVDMVFASGRSFTASPVSIPAYDPVRREHFLAVILVYRWRPQAAQALNADSLAEIGPPGCFYCHQDYSPEMAELPCPGEPQE